MTDQDATLEKLRAEFVVPLEEELARKDWNGRKFLAEYEPRKLWEAVIGTGIYRIIPAIQALAQPGSSGIPGVEVVAKDGCITARIDNSHVVRIEAGEPGKGFSTTEVEVNSVDPAAYMGIRRVTYVRMLRRAERHLVAAKCHTDAMPAWFRFCEQASRVANFPHEKPGELDVPGHISIESVRALEDAVSHDGGMPGEICKAIIEEQQAAILKAMLPEIAVRIMDIGAGLRSRGYVWNERYLAYDDTDKRTFAVPVDGAVAVYHDNNDLMADHCSYLAIVERDAEGAPASIRVHAVNRYTEGPSKLIGLVGEGAEPDPLIEYDLKKGDLGRTRLIDPTGIIHYLPFGVECDARILGEIANGTELDGGVEEMDDFDIFEPSEEDWGEDDEMPAPAA